MDFCRNFSVSGGVPSEYEQQEQLFSPSCSNLGTLDDLFSGNSPEGDVNLEWLSIFVEDCLSSSGNCLPPAILPPENVNSGNGSEGTVPKATSKPLQLMKSETKNTSFLHKLVIPGKARSKRKRCPAPIARSSRSSSSSSQLTSWSHHFNPQNQSLQMTSSDPPLLQQAYWLADSELILPRKESKNEEEEEEEEVVVVKREEKVNNVMVVGKEEEEEEDKLGSLEGSNGQQQQQQQPRRCTHCLAQRTPQWRAGPLGPKTLCNACGVRYKSGRLLPEYRPAKSPTFVSYKHSNSHKKVLEMRTMSLLPSNF